MVVELLQSCGLWIALGVVFLAMRWFGMRCSGRQHERGFGRKSRVVNIRDGNTDKRSEA